MMKRVLFACLFVTVGMCHAHADTQQMADDMNLTQAQKEQIESIRNAISHCVNHAEDKIRAMLTPEQKRILAEREGERVKWVLVN